MTLIKKATSRGIILLPTQNGESLTGCRQTSLSAALLILKGY